MRRFCTASRSKRRECGSAAWRTIRSPIIVHPTNPIGDVTLAQLSDLFQGRTFDWTPFGGTGEVIPVSREAEAYSRQIFEERVMQTRAVTRNAVLKASAKDVIDFVANTPGAIGYVPLSHLDERVKAIAIEGVAPSPEISRQWQVRFILAALCDCQK